MPATVYDVVILGGGITGTALLHVLSRYSDAGRIALVEKYGNVATVNSHSGNNSQTLHCGDIETNYSLERALVVNRAAQMVVRYASSRPDADKLIFRMPKMVLGVGRDECEMLKQRYKAFQPHFPYLELWDRDAIARVEPHVAKVDGRWREEEVMAIGAEHEYAAVDWGQLARAFVEQARAEAPGRVDLHFGARLMDIRRHGKLYWLETGKGIIQSRSVVVCAGAHSLFFAQRMGYGRQYACLPMAGNFYRAPALLNGKVYTVQNPRLPFAAVHGDRDVMRPETIRLGPTSLPVPLLERRRLRTLKDFLSLLRPDKAAFATLWGLLKVPDIRRFFFRNLLFHLPGMGTGYYLREARKILPGLSEAELQLDTGLGGLRPQLIDLRARQLMMTEAKIDTGNGIIFNMTPSPGATSCLDCAWRDAEAITAYLGVSFDGERLRRELVE